MSFSYPELSDAKDALVFVYKAAKNNTIQDDIPRFANAVWVLSGYGMKIAFGEASEFIVEGKVIDFIRIVPILVDILKAIILRSSSDIGHGSLWESHRQVLLDAIPSGVEGISDDQQESCPC